MKFFNWNLLKTKTFWTGAAAVVSGIGMIATTGDWQTGAQMIVVGILAMCGRDALLAMVEKAK